MWQVQYRPVVDEAEQAAGLQHDFSVSDFLEKNLTTAELINRICQNAEALAAVKESIGIFKIICARLVPHYLDYFTSGKVLFISEKRTCSDKESNLMRAWCLFFFLVDNWLDDLSSDADEFRRKFKKIEALLSRPESADLENFCETEKIIVQFATFLRDNSAPAFRELIEEIFRTLGQATSAEDTETVLSAQEHLAGLSLQGYFDSSGIEISSTQREHMLNYAAYMQLVDHLFDVEQDLEDPSGNHPTQILKRSGLSSNEIEDFYRRRMDEMAKNNPKLRGKFKIAMQVIPPLRRINGILGLIEEK